MKNIRMIVEYDGTDFYGWQEQPGCRTVQGELERGARQILNEEIRITGAGRTDRGVHALGQVAHFYSDCTRPLEEIRSGINAVTGRDVHVHSIAEVDLSFHSRFSALSKVYCYHIVNEPAPVRDRYVWHTPFRLDLERLEEGLTMLRGRHDFKNFSVQEAPGKNTVCEIRGIGLTRNGAEIIIAVEADRFLRRMVRSMVGLLIDIARGRYPTSHITEALNGNVKSLFCAPARGLFLVKVNY